MNTSELLYARLQNHFLADVLRLREPQEVVARMGAMQAQALEQAKWAIGVRLGGQTLNDVDEALNTGKIIRIHTLRPTWHFVSAEDVHWMFDLSVPHLRPVYRYYRQRQGVDEDLLLRALSLLEGLLSGGKHLTKQEIREALQVEKMAVDTVHVNHLISYAEMEGLVCNGRQRGGKQTFTSFAEWAPRRRRGTLLREEALERLARRFFTGHGPATVQDFAWWSGLRSTECREALELIKDDFVGESLGGRVFWMKSGMEMSPAKNAPLPLLLPPFDEYVVGYADRSEMIEELHYGKVMTKNGLFSPTVMLNGRIVGSWKRVMRKGAPQITLSFFEKTAEEEVRDLFTAEIRRVERFFGVKASPVERE